MFIAKWYKWAERSKPPPKNGNMASPLLKMASETLLSAAKRDDILIRNQLTSANKDKPGDDQRVGSRSGLPGVRSTGRTVEETFETLPDALFHRVTIRVRPEEYTGDRPSSWEILSYTAKGADLSRIDLALVHVPEKRKDPAKSLKRALSSAIQHTGRIRSVLIVGQQRVAGEPFRQR